MSNEQLSFRRGYDCSKEDGQSVIEKIWRERIEPINFYHGTSSIVRSGIKMFGLSPSLKPYSIDDLTFLSEVEKRLGLGSSLSSPQNDERRNKVYVTTRLQDAVNYAISGPEVLSLDVLPNSSLFIEMLEREPYRFHQSGLPNDTFERLQGLRQNAIALLNQHEPVLVEVDRRSKVLREAVGPALDMLESPEKFREIVSEVSKTGLPIDVDPTDLVTTFLTDIINQPIVKTIPPQELKIVAGNDFYALSPEAKVYGTVLRECFFDMDKHPPLLVGRIIHLRQQTFLSTDVLVSTATYFGFTHAEMEKVFFRVNKLNLENLE